MLCKHEVVGSIPSASTITFLVNASIAGAMRLGYREKVREGRSALVEIYLILWCSLERVPWDCLWQYREHPKKEFQATLGSEIYILISVHGDDLKYIKSIWWMPWRIEAMKDVLRCDKRRLAAKKL